MPRWRQSNTVNNGNLYTAQGGDINISGQPTTVSGQPTESQRTAPPAAGGAIRVLMLAANPVSTGRLAIDEEARQITERLRLSLDRDAFELITCWAVRPLDLQQYLNQHRPHIVHFSGHGDRTGELVLSAGDGSDRRVSAEGIAELLRSTHGGIRVVVLNACHSAAQVRHLGRHIDYVVGMRASITDEAATVFAAAFYSALGFRLPIPQAFDQAVAMLRVHGLAAHDIPELVARPAANPHLTIR